MKHLLIAVAACTALAACGGGTSDTVAANTPPAATDSGSTVDSFLAEVKRIVGLTSDSAEPSSTDAITVTTPEDKEPEPVS
jgi:hypothetical protein